MALRANVTLGGFSQFDEEGGAGGCSDQEHAEGVGLRKRQCLEDTIGQNQHQHKVGDQRAKHATEVSQRSEHFAHGIAKSN